jgi:acid phosphatase
MKQLSILSLLFSLITINVSAQKQPDHVVIVLLENHSYKELHDSTIAPYINSLLVDPNAALFTQSFALTHPSQPNYIMFFSGANQGIINDNLPTTFPFTAPNLGASLIQKGYTFTGYSETMPSVGYNGATSGSYARKHNPWVNWQGTGTNGIPSTMNQPLTAFPTDYTKLPTVSFVIPNLDDDMHNGTMAAGDKWLKNNLSNYVTWCKANNSLFILTSDEDDKTQNNQIMTVIIGQDVNGGYTAQPITHYSILRTIEDFYGLPYAGKSVDSTDIVGIWKTTLPIKLANVSAYNKTGKNIVEWTSASEVGAAYFEVQSSINGISFSTIASIGAKGSDGKYSFTDNAPVAATTYYRLKMVDRSGSFTFSKIVTVIAPKGNGLSVFPNPASKQLTVQVNTVTANTATLQIVDILGRTVYQQKTILNAGINTISLPITTLAKGSYTVVVNGQTIQQTQFFKQ